MLKLITSSTSPYARKVRVVLAEKKIEYAVVDQSPWTPGNTVSQYNPLGKIPVLLMDDGTSLFDSRVIVEYLDAVSPVSRLIPQPSRQRIAVKRWEALADGISDAAVAIVLELRRPAAQQSAEWVTRQQGKMQRGVAELARELSERNWCSGDVYTLADIAVGCTLGYLDLRHPPFDWRSEHTNLARLSDKLAKRPSFADTAPPDA